LNTIATNKASTEISDERKTARMKIQTAYTPLAFPLLVLELLTTNPAFLGIGFVFFIIALSSGKDREQEGDSSQSLQSQQAGGIHARQRQPRKRQA
jgi:hypothetical protein